MNSFYNATTIIREILESDEDVNTIVFGLPADKDLFKKSIYPLVNINPVGRNFSTSNTNIYEFEIAVLDQRDLSSKPIEDKFYSNSNLIDNLNTTDAVLNRLISRLRLQDNDELELVAVSIAKPVLFKDYGLMDGWIITIGVEMPNTIIDICNEEDYD